MTDPQRVYVTGGKVSVDDLGCLPLVVAVVLVIAILVAGSWVTNALDRNTAAMEAPACVPIEVEPLPAPAVLEDK